MREQQLGGLGGEASQLVLRDNFHMGKIWFRLQGNFESLKDSATTHSLQLQLALF